MKTITITYKADKEDQSIGGVLQWWEPASNTPWLKIDLVDGTRLGIAESEILQYKVENPE